MDSTVIWSSQETNRKTSLPSGSSKTRSSQNYEFPDSDEFINTTHRDSSLPELQNAVVVLAKSISETRAKLNQLIPKNFVKFIACKGAMESIGDEYARSGLVFKSSETTVSSIIAKFENLLKKHNVELDEGRKGNISTELSKDASLLTLKEVLRSNIPNFPMFTEMLGKNKKMLQDSTVLDEIKPEIVDFLNAVYEKIVGDGTGFEEACNLMDIYLQASIYQKDLPVDQKHNKITTTILVNFKESTFSRMKMTDGCYSYLFKSIIRVLRYLKDEQIEDAIHHLFHVLYLILSKSDPKYSRMVFRTIEDFIRSADISTATRNEFADEFSTLKTDLFAFFVKNISVAECINIFDIFLSVFNEKETKRAQSMLLKKAEKHLISSNKHCFEYLRDQSADLNALKCCLGSKESKNVKQLERRISDKTTVEINQIAKEFGLLFSSLKDMGEDDEGVLDEEIKILVEMAKIIDKMPEYHTRIIYECRNLIVERKVIHYFLRNYLKDGAPALNSKERKRVDLLSFQFDFFLKKK